MIFHDFRCDPGRTCQNVGHVLYFRWNTVRKCAPPPVGFCSPQAVEREVVRCRITGGLGRAVDWLRWVPWPNSKDIREVCLGKGSNWDGQSGLEAKSFTKFRAQIYKFALLSKGLVWGRLSSGEDSGHFSTSRRIWKLWVLPVCIFRNQIGVKLRWAERDGS